MRSFLVICIFTIIFSSLSYSCKSIVANADNNKDVVFKQMAEKLSTVENKLNKKTVAVYGFEMIGRKDDAYSKYATEKLTHELVDTDKLMVIERSMIDKVLQEQKLSKTGLIDARMAAKIGKILSVEAVIIGSINVQDNEVELMGRVIQSETAMILKSADVRYLVSDGSNSKENNFESDNKKENFSPGNNKNYSNSGIIVPKKIFNRNERITIKYSGLPGNKHDWITLVAAGKPDNNYGQWFYTSGAKNGEYTFGAVKPGIYEIRIYYNWPAGGYIVQKRLKIKVN